MMYVILALVFFIAALVAGNILLSWALAVKAEDQEETEARAREPRSFYKTQTWLALRRLLSKRPPLLTYRRDKNGRFKKLNPGSTRQLARAPRPRAPRRPRPQARRHRLQLPAE